MLLSYFFFNDTATTEIYTLSLHDALPIWPQRGEVLRRDYRCRALPTARAAHRPRLDTAGTGRPDRAPGMDGDRKSTRLNSSHANISYAVFCLKKKKTTSSGPASTG